jgi:hypothetical protein
MKKLGQISLPQDHPQEYSRKLSVMLYQYLRDITQQINELIDEVQVQNYATRYDQDAATPTLAYLGKAQVGTATSAASWQIQKLDFGIDGDVTVTWADGNAGFDNVWDNRASLSYS